MKPSLSLRAMKSNRTRRASLRPFLTLSSINMTGDNLINYIRDTDKQFRDNLHNVQPEVMELYMRIIGLVERIALTNGKKRIPSEFASHIRAILCYYFRDVNEFHIQGLSGPKNLSLKQSYETVAARLSEIHTQMAEKEARS